MIAILLVASILDAGPTDKIALNPPADIAITAAGLVGWVGTEALKDHLAPAQCRICDESINGVDGFFHDNLTSWLIDRKSADTASNVLVYALLPLGGLAAAYTATGPHASEGAGVRAVAVVAEAVAVQGALVQAFKFSFARQRPFARYGHGEASGTYDATAADSRISLPSGHTGFATALGVSVAMTASLQESPAAPWLWGAAAAATITTASLRMMAEKHYFTDTLGGAAIGAACGVVFPLLHKRGNALSVSTAQGPSIALSGTF